MKIAIFENQKDDVIHSFKILNIEYFENNLEFVFFEKFQDFGVVANVRNYVCAFVDLSLSPNTTKDGFQIIRDILAENPDYPVAVITGKDNYEKDLIAHDLTNIPVFTKPIDLDLVGNKMFHFINKAKKQSQ